MSKSPRYEAPDLPGPEQAPTPGDQTPSSLPTPQSPKDVVRHDRTREGERGHREARMDLPTGATFRLVLVAKLIVDNTFWLVLEVKV